MEESEPSGSPIERSTVEVLEDLLAKAQAGTLGAGAIRWITSDGQEHELAWGDSDEERAAAMSRLRGLLGELH